MAVPFGVALTFPTPKVAPASIGLKAVVRQWASTIKRQHPACRIYTTAAFKAASYFVLPPASPRGVRGRVRTAISL